ncbi:MAG: cyanophycin synthetase [Rhodothermales bacterium]|nr:cyanophycin synthetase [Rhodothermales bacterium]MCA0268832.1 cyanophycin synthetase [Bacteroidota bacterium]
MQIRSTNVYLGPNLYAHFPVIRHVVDLGPLEEWPTGRLGTDFVEGIIAAVPTLERHGCSYRTPGGFLRRMREGEGTWLGHVYEHVAIELQNVAGADVTFGKTRGVRGEDGVYNVVYEYEQRDVGLEAGDLARRLVLSLLPAEAKALLPEAVELPGDDFDFQAELERFIRFAQRLEFGPSTRSLVQAARKRDIPWIRLNNHSLVQFGHGKYQKRIQATITSETRHIATEIASDKEETHNLLKDLGLPVPKQELTYSVSEAQRAARRIGYPVVVKPLDANHGRGVSINLTTPEQIEVAFAKSREEGKSRGVLVEQFVTGFDHRLLVVNGRLVAAAKRVPGHVVGDGTRTVEQLVEIVNQDPRRGIGHEKVLTRLELDHQATRLLEEAGLTPESVLPEGETFYLRSTANLSTGGTSIDVTDVMHPDNREMAERAVLAIGLDVGGVDFLSPDITQSYKDVGGAIVEVNAAPGFRMHVAPSEGTPRDVASPVMDMLFPPGTPTRIPIAAITGTNGKTTTTRMVAHIFKQTGHTVGMTTTDGVYIDGKLTVKGDMTGSISAQMVLRDPMVDVAILETARGGLLRAGMGYRRANVGACLNVQADHLGLKGIDTLDELAAVKQIVIEVAKDCAVLNADDERCLKMAAHTPAERIAYVTMDPQHELVRAHIEAGGMALVLEQGAAGDLIALYDQGTFRPVMRSHEIPATLGGAARFNVQNAMFAAAIAYAMGKSLDDIRLGLATFSTSNAQVPGRFNVYDELAFRVVLDYAHNPAAMEAATRTVQHMDAHGQKIGVLSAPGDRRDEDIRNLGRLCASAFDRMILKTDDHTRGRSRDEILSLLREGLSEGGWAHGDDTIEAIPDEQEAIQHALRTAQHGDLVVIFGDDVARSWKQITDFRTEAGPSTSAPTTEDETPHFTLPSGMRLVRDTRGVRLA